jgi:hypothetical protein
MEDTGDLVLAISADNRILHIGPASTIISHLAQPGSAMKLHYWGPDLEEDRPSTGEPTVTSTSAPVTVSASQIATARTGAPATMSETATTTQPDTAGESDTAEKPDTAGEPDTAGSETTTWPPWTYEEAITSGPATTSQAAVSWEFYSPRGEGLAIESMQVGQSFVGVMPTQQVDERVLIGRIVTALDSLRSAVDKQPKLLADALKGQPEDTVLPRNEDLPLDGSLADVLAALAKLFTPWSNPGEENKGSWFHNLWHAAGGR